MDHRRSKTPIEVEVPPKPEEPCWVCGSTDFWLRRGFGQPEWLCSTCHPEVKVDIKLNSDGQVQEVRQDTGEIILTREATPTEKQGQPTRVAWRILRAWVKAQTAILETEMVVLEEVFLPYMVVEGKKTLYEELEGRGFLALPQPKDKQ